MNDVRYFTVLPDDKECIMSILQNAIDETRLPDEFERLQFCFRFGEKCTNGIKLDAFDLSEIIRVTVHSAIDIRSDVFDLMWSMTGLQKVVGSKGVLSTCLSFRDCGNFQSNLDGKLMDISKDLRDICHNTSGELLFMQLYVDIPHRKPKSRFHPVSGCIAGGLVFHKDTYSAFTRDANSYISTLDSNFSLMNRSSCRLEVVQEVRQVKMMLHATDFINVDNVYSLLKNQPLIVPFDIGMVAAVQKLGLFMTTHLKELLGNYSGTGNIEATWKAYQLELAAEKLLWGTPFASASYLLSVNLGPGRLEESRSLTDDKGFLALEKWTASMATEYSIPPCCVWTTSQPMQSKIRRVVGLHDVLESSAFVVGRRMVHTLLVDLYEGAKMFCRLEEFKREMFSDTPTSYRVSGGVTLSRLAELLSSNRRLGVHMVFGYQVKLIRKTQLDLGVVILDGLNDLRLKHFPALKLYDVHGHQTLCWDTRFGLWQICYKERNATEMQPSPMLLTKLIITELELRRLVYASKLKSLPIRFPWIASCVKKLSREKLSDDQLVCLLSFISCVALIMNGWFVDYDAMQTLCTDLPVTQHRLKDLEIQSKLLLSKCNTTPVYRLHQSIPTIVTVREKKESASTLKDQPQMDVRVEEVLEKEISNTCLISADSEEQNDQRIKPRAATCLPLAKGMCRWIAEEIEILYMVLGRKRKHDEGYEMYKDECLKKNVPFHGKDAFRRKIQRVAKDIGSQT
ncbi:hypothetical protein DPMN_102391 [Dreissena polymorpha]|uniref:Uncharacterized protein n=1 Tax=Dreissena polymorpha TaxID=45954 RepID=A0A9D4R918_DREPO|nr:hypothetical protein DPMN_102391 [Dreissena polymorpha]